MLRYLNRREKGDSNPLELYRAEVSRRIFNIRLSDHDVEKIFKGSVNSLDLDLVEKRYLLAGGSDGYIVIYDTNAVPGLERNTYQSVGTVALNNKYRHKFSVETVNWYPLDTGMFTSSGTDCLLKVWDTNRLKPADEYQFSGIVYNHHMSPVATKHCLIAVATKSASVKLVDLKSGSASHSLKGHSTSVFTVKWSPYNEFMLATGSADNKIFLWDIRNAKGSLLLFDQYNGKPPKYNSEIQGVTSHSGCVNGVQFSADGLHLISCGNDNTVHLWDTFSGRNLGVNYGRVVNSLKKTMHFAVSDGCTPDLIFMPNEAYRSVDAFNMISGKKEFSLTGHYAYVNCCVFNADKHELFSAGSDRNILVFLPHTKNSLYTGAKKAAKTRQNPIKTENTINVKKEPETNHVSETVTPSGQASVTSVTADSWSSDEES